jgi:hypothetical protein
MPHLKEILASVAVGISCVGPLGGKQGFIVYPIAVPLNSDIVQGIRKRLFVSVSII